MFKNTVVADHMHDRRGPFFSLHERHGFRRTLLVPLGFQVWIGSIPDQHGIFSSMDHEMDRTVPLSFHLNAFNYAVGHFAAQSVTSRYFRRNDRRHAPQLYVTQDSAWDQVSIPFWPSIGNSVKWPPSAHMGRDVFDKFFYRWKRLTIGPGLRPFMM